MKNILELVETIEIFTDMSGVAGYENYDHNKEFESFAKKHENLGNLVYKSIPKFNDFYLCNIYTATAYKLINESEE